MLWIERLQQIHNNLH